MTKHLKINPWVALLIILIIGSFFRFYKLDWGEGHFFHPDENTVGTAVSQLHFPDQMHPHLYTYGSFIVYLIYFVKLALDQIFTTPADPLIVGRFISAFLSSASIVLIYFIAQSLVSKRWALLSSLFVTLTPGLIQQAHFTTPEPFLVFFLLASLYFLLQFIKTPTLQTLLFASALFGLAIGCKISSAVFGLTFLIPILTVYHKHPLKIITSGLFSLFITLLVFIAVSPFTLIELPQYLSTFQYEGKLASGEISIFYTRQFLQTTSLLFQIEKIFPYATGVSLLVGGIFGFLALFLPNSKSSSKARLTIGIAFLSLLIPNLILFVKWTRYMTTVLPFFSLFTVYFLMYLYPHVPRMTKFLSSLIILTALGWTLAFFSIYIQPDSRVQATDWLNNNTPPNTKFLVEGANVYDVPLSGDHQKTSLDFYNLEDSPENQAKVAQSLLESDYFIIQSRRVFINHTRLENMYPQTARFYQALFSNQLGFVQIKQIVSYPSLSYLGIKLSVPDELAEETWSVFDHPVIRVFKKVDNLTYEEYLSAF